MNNKNNFGFTVPLVSPGAGMGWGLGFFFVSSLGQDGGSASIDNSLEYSSLILMDKA